MAPVAVSSGAAGPDSVSVIIPTLDEAHLLPATLAAVAANRVPHEVLVVDGGSRDQTVALALAAGARVFHSARAQRAAQMNRGIQEARGEALLFLHADTRLAPSALAAIIEALRNSRVVGGAFVRWFDDPSLWLRLSCLNAWLRARWFGWFFGDQAIFARRSACAELGGFAEQDVFEDLDFSRRLTRLGRWRVLTPAVVSSARRFRRGGVLRTMARDAWLTVRHVAEARR